MRRLCRRNLSALALALSALALVSACGARPDPFAGQYFVKGGGTPLSVFRALSAEFIKRHPGVTFDFEDTGSAPGMAQAAAGDIDLALASTEPTGALKEQLTLISLGISGTAIVVNAANPVRGLTKDQARGIFTGQITDWAAVGGTPGKIFVGTRVSGSAIQKSLDAYLFGTGRPTYSKDAFELNDTTQMLNVVANLREAISIVTSTDPSTTDGRVRLLSLDNVAPTKENLVSGAYPMRRPLYLAYRAAGVRPAIQAFIDFVRGGDGQAIIAAANAPS